MIRSLNLPTGICSISTSKRPMASRPKITIAAYAPSVDSRKPATLYEVLRVKENASSIEIKMAYRTLAKRFHPDAISQESDGKDFMAIREAYTTLSDPTARAIYDVTIGSAGTRLTFSMGNQSGFATPRRWETDQCW